MNVSSPRYRYRHQQERKRWQLVVDAGDAYCAEPVCVMPTRWIAPGSKWHLCHDPSGTSYIGPGHARCNTREGAARGNRMRARRRRPAPPPTAGRWTL